MKKDFAHIERKKSFGVLMIALEEVSKIISSHVRKVGLSDLLGISGSTNKSGDEVKRIDEFANELLTRQITNCGQVHCLGSEENPDVVCTIQKDAPFDIYFDPLDGSGNTENGGSVGTIFSIYKTDKTHTLRKGSEQVAAGYVLYGATTIFVFATDEGVNGFTLDPSTGCYVLSHPNMKFPTKPKVYVANEANEPLWSDETKKYVRMLKTELKLKHRNAGCLVADFHNILTQGGVFLYPTDSKNPSGKLRLVYEVNPISFIAERASGKADSEGTNPLTMTPNDIHEKVGFAVGNVGGESSR